MFYGFGGRTLDYFTHNIGPPTTDTGDLRDDDTPIDQEGYLTDLLGNRPVTTIETFAREVRPAGARQPQRKPFGRVSKDARGLAGVELHTAAARSEESHLGFTGAEPAD